MLFVVVHFGSRTAGYSTPAPSQLTRTVQLLAPGAVTGRPHGPAGFLSTAHPSTDSVASVRSPSAPTTNGGAARKRGAPPWSSISSVPETSRNPATPLRSAIL